MDYLINEKDITIEIEQYMNENSQELLGRVKAIIDKFEIYKTKKTEEDFKMEFTPILTEIAKKIEVEYEPKFEKYVKSGRMDCFYNCINLEYKVPGAIEPLNNYPGRKSSNLAYIDEVHRQIVGYSSLEKINKNKILGIIFDGKYIIYTYYLSTDWHVSAPQQLNETTLEEFIKRLFSTEIKGKAVCVSNLVEDFGVDSDISKNMIRNFYKILNETSSEKIKMLFLQWKSLFREVSGYNSESLKMDIDEIVNLYNIKRNDLKIDYLIFSIQSYYAILIKLLVTEMLNQKRMKLDIDTQMNFNQSESAYAELVNIETGKLFEQFGISNLIENDFFSWYLEEWNENQYQSIKQFLRRVSNYNFNETTQLDDNGSQDLLRNLYNYLMPKTLRHSLGEYYSPDWLAQQTYNETNIDGDINKSVLDPTCGSGTFIVIAIKSVIEKNKGKVDDEVILDSILSNIHGFDLNPLAVITARANYLLALGDLINCSSKKIEIPIYHCDAMLTVLEENREEHFVRKISTRAGIFEIPKEICDDKDDFYKMLDIIKFRIENFDSFDMLFWNEFCKERMLDKADKILFDLTKRFYEQIALLKQKDILSVWIQIIKNAFIPLFHRKVDYIIGNPPWINWQTLPEDYRESIHKHWYNYKIFDFKGLKARLGSAHDDISVLLTYVVMDNFLKDGGKLSFIINQNLLQAYGGGEGFRKFMIKEEIPVKVLKVDDYVEVEPFLSLGASNKSAVIYLEKNSRTEYPVQYNKWKKNDRGIIDAEDTLESVMTKIDYTSEIAIPVNKNIFNSSWMIGTVEELKVFQNMVGKSNYVARKGVDTSANGIFWIEIKNEVRGKIVIRNTPENSKKSIPQVECAIEKKYVFPLVRGKDIKKWKFKCPYSIIVPYEDNMKKTIDKETLQKESENLYKYFYDDNFNSYAKEFQKILVGRGTYIKHYANMDVPEYVLYNIGDYTSSPYKVIWKALASKGMEACVISSVHDKLVIPDHNNVLIPLDNKEEAYYLCSLLNSKLVGNFIDSYISWFKSNHILENINIPEFDIKNDKHRRLSQLGEEAHLLAEKNDDLSSIESKIEEAVRELFIN